jgi:CheY-like chemotaxis protein
MGFFRILVADDFAPWRRYLRSLVGERANLNVVSEAVDGLEAVQKVTERSAAGSDTDGRRDASIERN